MEKEREKCACVCTVFAVYIQSTDLSAAQQVKFSSSSPWGREGGGRTGGFAFGSGAYSIQAGG